MWIDVFEPHTLHTCVIFCSGTKKQREPMFIILKHKRDKSSGETSERTGTALCQLGSGLYVNQELFPEDCHLLHFTPSTRKKQREFCSYCGSAGWTWSIVPSWNLCCFCCQPPPMSPDVSASNPEQQKCPKKGFSAGALQYAETPYVRNELRIQL